MAQAHSWLLANTYEVTNIYVGIRLALVNLAVASPPHRRAAFRKVCMFAELSSQAVQPICPAKLFN